MCYNSPYSIPWKVSPNFATLVQSDMSENESKIRALDHLCFCKMLMLNISKFLHTLYENKRFSNRLKTTLGSTLKLSSNIKPEKYPKTG